MGNKQFNFFTYKSAVEGHEYDYNPNYNQERLWSDYTLFYAGIGISTAIFFILVLINVLFACCGPWRKYWLSRYTGNRYVTFIINYLHKYLLKHLTHDCPKYILNTNNTLNLFYKQRPN